MNYDNKYREYADIHNWFVEEVERRLEKEYDNDFSEVNGKFDVYYSSRFERYIYFDRESGCGMKLNDCLIGDLHKILRTMDNGENWGKL